MRILICYFMLISLVSFAGEARQRIPNFNTPQIVNLYHVLEDVSAIQVIDNDTTRGVLATYKVDYGNINRKARPGDYDWLRGWQKNDNVERIFITGLNHDEITNDCYIWHYMFSGQRFLYVWPIGIQILHVKSLLVPNSTGKEVRYKKYTVSPQEAISYYSIKKKQFEKDSDGVIGQQSMPKISNPQLINTYHILEDVTTLEIVENETNHGVLATYRVDYNNINRKARPGDYDWLRGWVKNDNFEQVFITGINHACITNDSFIWHYAISGQHFLYVWPIGIQVLHIKSTLNPNAIGKEVRYKKYTVSPKEALEYIMKKKAQ